MVYRKKKTRSGKCVKVTKYEANLKEAHERVPKKDKRLERKKKGRRKDKDASVQIDICIGMINTQTKNDLKLNNHALSILIDQ
jgi:hypothetical protein